MSELAFKSNRVKSSR